MGSDGIIAELLRAVAGMVAEFPAKERKSFAADLPRFPDLSTEEGRAKLGAYFKAVAEVELTADEAIGELDSFYGWVDHLAAIAERLEFARKLEGAAS